MIKEKTYDIAIIGGGASGLMLAAQLDLRRLKGSSPHGGSGIILEGSPVPGSKLLMSGGGRCNITHGGPIREFPYAYGDAGPSLRRCLYRHSNMGFVGWLDSHGLKLAEEDGRALDISDLPRGASALEGTGRIFPSSMKAQEVLELFLDEAGNNGWELSCGSKVSELQSDQIWDIGLTSGKKLAARNVVVASGGITYPETGSDGSMFGVLKKLGADITEPRPALAPVYVEDYPYSSLSGISVPDVSVTTFSEDAACTCKGSSARMKGDLLFTHKGFSGPVILNISRYAEPGQKIRIRYNKEFDELPKRMQRIITERSKGPSGDVRTTLLASLLDRDDFTVSAVDSRGMVTAGGISLHDIDLKSMQIKAVSPGSLYAIGEAIDADGITGGYNLQLCWSTASAAAEALTAALMSTV